MYKKVAFEYSYANEGELATIETVLMVGYPLNGVVYRTNHGCDGIGGGTITFNVNRLDLSDLRNDVEVLKRGGIDVREVEAL